MAKTRLNAVSTTTLKERYKKQQEWAAARYDHIGIAVKKEGCVKKRLETAAERNGKSVNQLVVELIEKFLEAEQE